MRTRLRAAWSPPAWAPGIAAGNALSPSGPRQDGPRHRRPKYGPPPLDAPQLAPPGGIAVPPPSLRRLGGQPRRAVAETQPPATARRPPRELPRAKRLTRNSQSSNPRTWTIEMEPGTPIISANHRLNRYALNRQVQDLKDRIGGLIACRAGCPASPQPTSWWEYVSPPAAEAPAAPAGLGLHPSTQTTSRRQGKRWSMASGPAESSPQTPSGTSARCGTSSLTDAPPRAAAGAYHRSAGASPHPRARGGFFGPGQRGKRRRAVSTKRRRKYTELPALLRGHLRRVQRGHHRQAKPDHEGRG